MTKPGSLLGWCWDWGDCSLHAPQPHCGGPTFGWDFWLLAENREVRPGSSYLGFLLPLWAWQINLMMILPKSPLALGNQLWARIFPSSAFTRKGELHDSKVVLTKSVLPSAPSPVWDGEKLSELMTETICLGLVSKDVLSRLWDGAQRKGPCVLLPQERMLHLRFRLENRHKARRGKCLVGRVSIPFVLCKSGPNLDQVTIHRSPHFDLINQLFLIIKMIQISGRVTLPH